MKCLTLSELNQVLSGCAEINGGIKIRDAEKFRGEPLDQLVYNAVFNPDPKVRGQARFFIRSAAWQLGLFLASIQELYMARGKGKCSGFTVPAINIRGMTFDVSRAVIRAAMQKKVGPFIFEIAKSEMGYTYQRPSEYAVAVLAAAIKEGLKGPVFVQGDHFQANAKKYKEDPKKEVDGLKNLIKEAISAGFYNIDIDTSTLVDLDKKGIKEQQRVNFELCAEFTRYIRSLQPPNVTISVGGEIGEVGGKNSTQEELEAFIENYNETLEKMKVGPGISKISIQTGTSHGGVPLPDGTVADVQLDFDTLAKLSKVAREKYGLSGAVQHGASTLPDEAFHHFPQKETAEIHLATAFQNMIYESKWFPADFREELYAKLRTEFAAEKKKGETDEQFIYKTRKKGFGVMKEAFWNLPDSVRTGLRNELQSRFEFLYQKLNVGNTVELVQKTVTPVEIKPNLAAEIEASK